MQALNIIKCSHLDYQINFSYLNGIQKAKINNQGGQSKSPNHAIIRP